MFSPLTPRISNSLNRLQYTNLFLRKFGRRRTFPIWWGKVPTKRDPTFAYS